MKKSLSAKFSLAAVIIAAATTYNAAGATIAYEGFDYGAGTSLVGANGGTGFSTAWGTSTGSASMVTPGLSYDVIPASGNALRVDAATGTVSIFRDMSTARGAEGTTTWISLIHQRTGTPVGTSGVGGGPSLVRPVNIAFFEAGTERFGLGEGTRTTGDEDVFGFVVAGNVANAATRWTTAPITDQNFALLRIDHGVGDVDTAYLWMNPTLGSEPSILSADITSTGDFDFNRIRPFAGNTTTAGPAAEGLIDEIRIGETFLDVAPVPEPSTYALMGLGAIAFLFNLRRKK